MKQAMYDNCCCMMVYNQDNCCVTEQTRKWKLREKYKKSWVWIIVWSRPAVRKRREVGYPLNTSEKNYIGTRGNDLNQLLPFGKVCGTVHLQVDTTVLTMASAVDRGLANIWVGLVCPEVYRNGGACTMVCTVAASILFVVIGAMIQA